MKLPAFFYVMSPGSRLVDGFEGLKMGIKKISTGFISPSEIFHWQLSYV